MKIKSGPLSQKENMEFLNIKNITNKKLIILHKMILILNSFVQKINLNKILMKINLVLFFQIKF